MRATPQQYFQGYETQQLETNNSQPDHTLHFIIIAIVAGLALGLAIAATVKK